MLLKSKAVLLVNMHIAIFDLTLNDVLSTRVSDSSRKPSPSIRWYILLVSSFCEKPVSIYASTVRYRRDGIVCHVN